MRTLMCAVTSLWIACGGGDDAVDVGPDAEPEPEEVPYIGEVLDCGTPASAGGLASGTELQRVDLDLAVFPDALCNDGTPGFFYFRPAATAAARDRWVIQLQGGGACGFGDTCAKRWCSVDTNFGMTQMTATLSPAGGIPGDGILQRGGAGAGSPLADSNHVFVRYCSSDGWAGTAGPVDVDAAHPMTGEPVRFRIAFGGAHILDAVLAMLRRDGAAPPGELPDLDDADAVVFAGASAGGTGVTHNADRVRELLEAHNPDVPFFAIIDSTFGPDRAALDWTATPHCTDLGLCSYEDVMRADTGALSGRQTDASCATWHADNAPETAWLCNDSDHIHRHHMTSPFLMRMGLTDSLIAGNYVEAGFAVPGRGAMTVELFAELVRADLLALPASDPEEPFARPPAVYGPRCPDHETLSNNAGTFGTTVVADGEPRTMLEVAAAFVGGTSPTAAVWGPGDPVDCD